MAQQNIGVGRLEQRTAGAKVNANFSELYSALTVLSLNAITANTSFVVPAGYIVDHIVFNNTTANAVTGGLKVGTTNGGTEVVTAQPVGASELGSVAGASIAKRIFSTSASTTLYIQAVTAWNSATVSFRIALRKMF